MTAVHDQAVLAAGRAALGQPEERIEGSLKVTGRARYTADFRPAGMLWARYLLSPHPHARIRSIDVSAARSMPGVHAVLTGTDIGPVRIGRALMDWPALAYQKVRFVGERVAAVAAETPELADRAVTRIVALYDELPAVLDPATATARDAPVLHEEASAYTFLPGSRPAVPHPNVQGVLWVKKGEADIGDAFARADGVFEHVFHTPRQHTGYIEPHGALVWIDDAGVVHLLCTNKAPFVLRRQFAVATGLPAEQVVVEPDYIGGDFGGKGLSLDELDAYYLARASGRPVRSVVSYADDMQNSTTRHAATIRLRTGVDRAGRFVAHEADLLFDGGAYAAGKALPSLVPIGGLGTLGPYQVPNTSITLTVVYTNTVPGGHMRAPGEVQAQFAGESHVDMIARELGYDPLEFRLRNVLQPGQVGPANERFRDVRAVEVLEALRRAAPASDSVARHRRGRGVALAVRGIFQGSTSVRYRLERTGRVTLITGVPEQGSGMHTMLKRVAATVLSIDPRLITVVRGSTSDAPFDPGASASWVTTIAGQAAARGATELKTRLEELAAEARGWPAGQVHLADDNFSVASTGERAPFSEVAQQIAGGGDVMVDGTYEPPAPGGEADANFAAYLAEVEVDPETGQVDVRNVVLAMDVGTIINPVAHQGQLDGSLLFGLGTARMEELVVTDGRPVNVNLAEYKLPTQLDMPAFKTVLVPTTVGPGPFGVKAAGEVTNSAVAPAIANAVADATGARVVDLPLTPERVLRALRQT
ncbi:MAG: xanthine dehydrogenase family protein molybdopterin-binding subunit [Chloroflexi bacterium]|nr:xanthine dehydrogenase family protein molybdopterin-binding subunit [Chloroflexota bacterium]